MKRAPKEIALDDVPFYKSLLKRSRLIFLTRSGKVRREFNPHQRYQKEITEICLRISSLMETLRLSRFFLWERIEAPNDRDLKVKNAEFIRYHIECYFLRITTYKDLLLKLYNRVYRLQVRENIGLEPNLKKTAARHNNELLAELIERLSILMKSLEPIRHRIAHGGYHMDYDLILIEAEEAGRGSGRSGIMPEEEYAAVQKNLLTRNILEMYEIEKTMATFVIAVFKKLYPVRRLFEKQLQRKDQF